MLSLMILGMIQTTSGQDAVVPASVISLGKTYSENYVMFSNNLRAIGRKYAPGLKVNTVEELLQSVNDIWNPRTDRYPINYSRATVTNLEGMVKSNNYSVDNISLNRLSSGTMNFIKEIIQGLESVNDQNSLDNYLLGFSTRLSSEMLNEEERTTISYFIFSLNSTIEILNELHVQSHSEEEQLQGKMACCKWLKSLIKCAAVTVGGALTGGLAGAGVGTVLPGVGTVAGGIIGIIGGGLAGATAAGCFD